MDSTCSSGATISIWLIPRHTSAGWLWPYNPTGQDLRINPNFGIIRGMMWNTSSRYDALQLSVQKRLRRGLPKWLRLARELVPKDTGQPYQELPPLPSSNNGHPWTIADRLVARREQHPAAGSSVATKRSALPSHGSSAWSECGLSKKTVG
jgi:hypothetical protein